MKQLTCEMCGSTELIKQDGFFVCQTCGTKYSVEEAKKMMVEVSGTVEVTGTVKIDDTGKIEHYYTLAENAYDANNNFEAEKYCNKIIEIDSTDYKAWLLKGKAAGWQSTLSNVRIDEAINCFNEACENAPSDELVDVKKEIDGETYHLLQAMLDLAEKHFKDYPSEDSAIILKRIIQISCNYMDYFDQEVDRVNYKKHLSDNMIAFLPSWIHMGWMTAHTSYIKIGGANPSLETWQRFRDVYNVTTDLYKFYLSKFANNREISYIHQEEKNNNSKYIIEAYENLIEIKNTFSTSDAYTYTTVGYVGLDVLKKEDKMKIKNEIEECKQKIKEIDPNYAVQQPQSGGCYVATCVYGSYDCPEVWTLRRFRDETLGSTWYGRLFIRTYYAISPTLVKWFGNTNWFKKLWKGKLDRMVAKLQSNGVEDTPYEDKNW